MNFDDFFCALNDVESPFPWQSRLARQVIEKGWPELLDLPTGVGKTYAMEIALFHLIAQLAAIRDNKLDRRTAPLRIFLVVDRRIVVDGAYEHARTLAERLRTAETGVLAEAKNLLCRHFETDLPLQVSLMRGAMYRDDGWSLSPAQPTICVSTVDQFGSRLLFRGYGVSASMRPIHAGLVANDSLLLVDEAHLSNPFLQTLQAVRLFTSARFSERPVSRPLQVIQMSATMANDLLDIEPFRLDEDDREHPLLKQRLTASKIARLDKVTVSRDDPGQADDDFAKALVERAISLSPLTDAAPIRGRRKRASSRNPHPQARVIGIVVNRVRTARAVFDRLRQHPLVRDPLCVETDVNTADDERGDVLLLTGRIRPGDRDELLFRQSMRGQDGWLSWIRAGRKNDPDRPIFVVATQTVEVGADLDFDALVTEVAPLDCLRQRFGRLDRLGKRGKTSAYILGRSTDVAKTAKDRVYGNRLSAAWHWLNSEATGTGRNKSIDFGVSAMDAVLKGRDLDPLCAERLNAPVLLPPYLDLWVRTNPKPAADPDVSLFLHGPKSRPPDVQVVWRADVLPAGSTAMERKYERRYIDTVAMLPPTSLEACPVPLYEVQRWLAEFDEETPIGDLADVEGDKAPETDSGYRTERQEKLVLRWSGEKESKVVSPRQIRPGDTIVVPANYGGCDPFGWNPTAKSVKDIGELSSRLGRARPVVRFHPNLLAEDQWNVTLESSRPAEVQESQEARDFLKEIQESQSIPDFVRRSCRFLLDQRNLEWTPYREDDDSDSERTQSGWIIQSRRRLPTDIVLLETRGQLPIESDDRIPNTTDESSFHSGRPISLDEHSNGVATHAAKFTRLAELPNEVADDLQIVSRWHDVGKLDERFQTLLHDGDAAAAMIALAGGDPLAKSGQGYQHPAARRRARRRAGVPDGFRHEALSVILLRHSDLKNVLIPANDSELVEYIIGSHHGTGRPFHTVMAGDPAAIDTHWKGQRLDVGIETQMEQALHRIDCGWPDLFARMNRRYGWWGLAWIETIFRLADHRQSEHEARAQGETELEDNQEIKEETPV